MRPKTLKTVLIETVLYSVLMLGAFATGFSIPRIVYVDHWHGIDSVVLTDDVRVPQSVPYWITEIHRRFPDAFVVFCHGGDDGKEWVLATRDGEVPVKDYALQVVKDNPGREVVLIVCNPGHYTLNIPHVHYAMDSVWMTPDRSIGFLEIGRSIIDPECVGNIYEFR